MAQSRIPDRDRPAPAFRATAREVLAALARAYYHPEIEALIRQKLRHVADGATVEIEYHQHRPSASPWAPLLVGPQLPQRMLPDGSRPVWPPPDPSFVMRVNGVTVIDLPPGKLPSDLFIARLAAARHAEARRYLDELLSGAEPQRCTAATGAKWRQAVAAHQELPEKYRLRRGKPRAS
jgi:hypothetical protein